MTMRTAHAEIAADYRQKIRTGLLRPGDSLPTARQIMAEYGVSMATAAHAYQELSAAGLTTTRGPGHTVVAGHGSSGIPTRVEMHAESGRSLAEGETSQILDITSVAAPDAIANRLDVEPGTPVTARRRLVTRDGSPTHVSVSYYPQFVVDAAPELTRRSSTGGSRELAAMRLNSRQTRVLEEVTSRPAEADEGELLGLSGPMSTVTCVTRTVWLADGRVVEVATKIVRGTTVLKWSAAL
ncbi:GntR family transcriptional regulator [Streptomyces lonarensis]|nr:GntR family transcriptional regulator [Streptomyces lonarensis]